MEAPGEHGCREAGRTGAGYRDITRAGKRRRQETSVRGLRSRPRCLGDRAARVTAHHAFVAAIGVADDLCSMTAALRTYGRSLGSFQYLEYIFEADHTVIYSSNIRANRPLHPDRRNYHVPKRIRDGNGFVSGETVPIRRTLATLITGLSPNEEGDDGHRTRDDTVRAAGALTVSSDC